MVLATNWSDMWAMTGIGFGTVFVVLLLLVLILGIFNVVAKKKSGAPAASPALEKKDVATPLLQNVEEESDDIAAVATALCLYFQEVHDNESFVLTIHHHEHTAWHPEGY